MRREWSEKQTVIDIKQQLSGSAVDKTAQQVLQNEYNMPPAQISLLKKLLTWPKSDSLEDEWRRHNEAVEAVKLEEHPSISAWEAKCQAIKEHIWSAQKPEACFQCQKEYSKYRNVLRHFQSAHLSDHQCNFCLLPLHDEKDLRKHAARVYHLHT
ncbi:hypothetical protein CIRG_10349 [Coccidioides immitis RMSCC 2394]|uniref:C2H2-type domain-containing protein n=1 Tax=Coccidioides immitis RMSCC 2394 TaxID=404692 RepID=A0A0J6Y1N1_COCIT|nr:hypothetical protein CIRG_10349 [Coccidioides immitis RMSCC 2394]